MKSNLFPAILIIAILLHLGFRFANSESYILGIDIKLNNQENVSILPTDVMETQVVLDKNESVNPGKQASIITEPSLESTPENRKDDTQNDLYQYVSFVGK